MVWVRPKEYPDSVVSLRPGLEISRDKLLKDWWIFSLNAMILISTGKIFAFGGCGGDFPSLLMNMLSSRVFGDEIDRIREVEALTGQVLGEVDHLAIFPATHFVTNDDHMEVADC